MTIKPGASIRGGADCGRGDDPHRTAQLNALVGEVNAKFGAGAANYVGTFAPGTPPKEDASVYEAKINRIMRPSTRGTGRMSPQGWTEDRDA